MPKVSVCIASYNHARFLNRCLDSIFAQTFQDFEIVVVDDGSKDNSHEILLDYQARYPGRFHYFWHEDHANLGISKTTNRAIQESAGEYIAFIGSDDIWYPEKLERQVSLMDQAPELGFVYGVVDFIDDDDHQLPGQYGEDITTDPNPTGRMIQFCHPPAMSVIIRKTCLADVGLFNDNLVYSDWDLMVRAISRWKAGFIGAPIAQYRMHRHNVSHGNRSDIELSRVLALTEVLQKNLSGKFGQSTSLYNQALISLQLSYLYFCSEKENEAVNQIHSAFAIDPSLPTKIEALDNWLASLNFSFKSYSLPHFGFWFISHLPASVGEEARQDLFQRQLARPETEQFYFQRGIEADLNKGNLDTIFADWPTNLPLLVEWKRAQLKKIYPAKLFELRKTGDLANCRSIWLQTIFRDFSWILNRGIWSIGLHAFFPALFRSSGSVRANPGE